MSKLLEELRAIPAFNDFEKAVKEKLTRDNFYVEHFMPETGKSYEVECNEDGQYVQEYYTTADEAEEHGIDSLLNDNTDYFNDFVCGELNYEIVELARVLINEIRG